MSNDIHCANCVHMREGVPPDPMEGIRLVSKKVLELRARWQQELESRAMFEQERLLAGDAFDFEPYAFPFCEFYSKEKVVDPVSGKEHSLFVLCASANANSDCAEFTAKPAEGG